DAGRDPRCRARLVPARSRLGAVPAGLVVVRGRVLPAAGGGGARGTAGHAGRGGGRAAAPRAPDAGRADVGGRRRRRERQPVPGAVVRVPAGALRTVLRRAGTARPASAVATNPVLPRGGMVQGAVRVAAGRVRR